MKLKGLVVCVLSAAILGASFAQDDSAPLVTEKDYAVFASLNYAQELAKARKMLGRGDAAKQKAADEALAKAFADSGWDQDRYDEANDALQNAANVIQRLASSDKDEVDLAKEDQATLNAVTFATAKAHFKDIYSGDGLSDKALKDAQAEAAAALRGADPTPAQLQGRWNFDLDATVELNAQGFDADTKKKLRDSMGKSGYVAFVFGPGNAVEIVSKGSDGKNKSDKTSYRISDGKIYFMAGQSESSLDIGYKDGVLKIGMMQVYSVFKKGN